MTLMQIIVFLMRVYGLLGVFKYMNHKACVWCRKSKEKMKNCSKTSIIYTWGVDNYFQILYNNLR